MCECREPNQSGVRSASDNPPQLVIERVFTRNQYPSPMGRGNKGVPTRRVYASLKLTGHVSSWGQGQDEMSQCRTFDIG
jgi:hypothetical protein